MEVPSSRAERCILAGKMLSVVILAGCVAAFVAGSWHWPLVGDAPLFHYIVFLMRHGMTPYLDIRDPNLLGTYAVQAAVMSCFGAGELAWRLWDLGLLGAIGGCMLFVAGRGAGSLACLPGVCWR